jgi:DNA topoisomerase-1
MQSLQIYENINNSINNIISNSHQDSVIKKISTNIIGGKVKSHDEKHYYKGIARDVLSLKNNKFRYYYIKNNKNVIKKDIERIKKLLIPPAWTNVWISLNPNSNIQVIGTDSKNRKQYKYHEVHIEKAEQSKFLRLFKFIMAIPKLESIMKNHYKLPPFHKYKVISTMLTIVKELHIRVGKEQYVRENKSYGIVSLRKHHVKISGDILKFNFKGKSNQRLNYTLYHPTIKKHIIALQKLPGVKLFQYIDQGTKVKFITDVDLNNYIQTYMGNDFTAKDFRTYAANYYFVKSLLQETRNRTPKNPKIIKKNIALSINKTAFYLKHTTAISKKSYIMNFCMELYQNDPFFFIKNKYKDPDTILIILLKKYKKLLK